MAIKHKQARKPAVRNRNPHQGRQVPDVPGMGISIDSMVPGGSPPHLDQGLMTLRGARAMTPAQMSVDFTKIVEESEKHFLYAQANSLMVAWPMLQVPEVELLLNLSMKLIQQGYSQNTTEEAHRVKWLEAISAVADKLSTQTLEHLLEDVAVTHFGKLFRANCESMINFVKTQIGSDIISAPIEGAPIQPLSGGLPENPALASIEPLDNQQLLSTTAADNVLATRHEPDSQLSGQPPTILPVEQTVLSGETYPSTNATVDAVPNAY